MWGSAAGLPPPWRLSPLRSDGPAGPAPPTPGALYRSCFAAEAEAVALQLRGAPPTVEGERLAPLEAACGCVDESLPPPAAASPRNRTYDAASLCEDRSGLQRTYSRLPEEAPVPFMASTPLPARGSLFPPPPEAEQEPARPPGPRLGRSRLAAAEGAPRKSPAGPERAKSQLPLGQKPPPGRKSSLFKLPGNNKPRLSTQPTSRPSRGPELLTGLAPPGVGREKSPRTKLPVPAGSNHSGRKRPLERRLVQGSTPPQRQLASKRSCPGKSHLEKPSCGVLLDAGQIPPAPCSQCQQLAEENRRLRRMLENCERTITVLKQKREAT